jgi:hypothetical protein
MIRYANKFDNKIIYELLIDFHTKVPNRLSLDISKWSATYVDSQLAKIYAGAGFVLIDDNCQGFLCAVKQPCFWIPETYVLQEAMWHGKNKKISLKLLQEYLKIGKKMLDNKEVLEVYFTSFNDVDYSRYNVKKIGNDWIM